MHHPEALHTLPPYYLCPRPPRPTPLLVSCLALLALLAGSSACGGREEPIRVAFAGPVSGLGAADGNAGRRGIELVFEAVNAAGGIGGRPLVLDVYDDHNDPDAARANARTIVSQRGTVAVIGHNESTCALAASPVYAENGMAAITSAATNVAVTRGSDFYFRTVFNDRDQGRFLALYVREVLRARSVGIVHETDAYGAYLADVIDEAAGELRVGTERWSFDPASPSLGERLDAIVAELQRRESVPGALVPEALILAVQPAAGVELVRRLRDTGWSGALVVPDALASQAFAEGFRDLPRERGRPGFYTDGIYASTPLLFDAVGRRAADFAQKYLARYDESPLWYSAFAADAARVVVEALRRAELSPRAATIERDRRALRDAVAAIDASAPVLGVTGPTYFDATGDAEKPVYMGRFQSGEIVSAFGQLRLLPYVQAATELPERYDRSRVVPMGGRVFYRSDIARVGVLAEHFDAIDFDGGSFELDFHIWFRHRGDRAVEDIVFTNAIEPIELGEPVDSLEEESGFYRLYHTRGRFRTDSVDTPYGLHSMALVFHHRDRTRDDLVYAIDSVGMKLGRGRTRDDRTARSRSLLGPDSPWIVTDLLFYESELHEHAMGHPAYLGGSSSARPYSQMTIAAIVRGQALTLRGVVPPAYQAGLLVAALLGCAVLFTLRGGGAPRLRWLAESASALLVLLGAEPLLGNWLQQSSEPYTLDRLARLFDLLWWMIPALLVNHAVYRFIWAPAERRNGRPVPTLLRWSVAFVIFLLAVFGVIAFVYDYRLTGLLATSGVVAMIIGLAVQLNITNLFAGVAINLERPFRVGDWVMIHGRGPDPTEGVIGKVIDINWRTTRLETADDTQVVIPNGIISEKTITNFMQPREMSRFELFFTLDQSIPVERALAVIQAALDALTGPGEDATLVGDPAPKVRVNRVTEIGVEYGVRYRILPSRISPNKGRHRVNQKVLQHLQAAGIELAYPRRTIREERAEERGGDSLK